MAALLQESLQLMLLLNISSVLACQSPFLFNLLDYFDKNESKNI